MRNDAGTIHRDRVVQPTSISVLKGHQRPAVATLSSSPEKCHTDQHSETTASWTLLGCWTWEVGVVGRYWKLSLDGPNREPADERSSHVVLPAGLHPFPASQKNGIGTPRIWWGSTFGFIQKEPFASKDEIWWGPLVSLQKKVAFASNDELHILGSH